MSEQPVPDPLRDKIGSAIAKPLTTFVMDLTDALVAVLAVADWQRKDAERGAVLAVMAETREHSVTLDLRDAMLLVLWAEQTDDDETLAAMRRAKQACSEAPGYAAPY